jgi:hypothetical protein
MPDLDPRPCARRSSCPVSRRPSRVARVALVCAVAALCAAALMALTGEGAQAGDETARFTVRDVAVAPSAQATTATIVVGGEGARMMPGGDFEPAIYRNWLIATAAAPNAVTSAWYFVSQFDTLRDGALDGAEISIMRLENGAFREVRADRVARHHVSGWMPELPFRRMLAGDRREIELPRASWSRPDVTRWFTVRAVDRRGRVSPTAAPVLLRLGANGKGGGIDRDALIPAEAEPDAPADPRGPAAPRDLRARGNGAGGAILSWTAADGDPAGWMVYASATPPEAMVGFRFDLAGDGPPVRAGDLAIVRARTLDPDRTRMIADRIWGAKAGMMLRPGPLGFWSDEDPRATWALRPHAPDDGSPPSRDPAEDWGGESYLEMTLARGATRAIGAYNHSGTDQDFYEVLRPGIPYEVSVRLRADRPGMVRFRLSGPLAGDVAPVDIPVGTEWALHTTRFTVPGGTDGAGVHRSGPL